MVNTIFKFYSTEKYHKFFILRSSPSLKHHNEYYILKRSLLPSQPTQKRFTNQSNNQIIRLNLIIIFKYILRFK